MTGGSFSFNVPGRNAGFAGSKKNRRADTSVQPAILEQIEPRVLLAATSPIEWNGATHNAVTDEWVIRLSDEYIVSSRKLQRTGLGDEEMGPFLTLSSAGGYGISDISVERAKENVAFAILRAPFANANQIRQWGEAFSRTNPITQKAAAFESVTPHFVDMVIPSTLPTAAQTSGKGVNIVQTDPQNPNLVDIEWAGLSGKAARDHWSLTFDSDFFAANRGNTLTAGRLIQSLADYGLSGARIEVNAEGAVPRGRLFVPVEKESAVRQWVESRPEVIGFFPDWQGQPAMPPAPNMPAPEPVTASWKGQTAQAAKDQWSVTFSPQFTSENPGNDLTGSSTYGSLAAFGVTGAKLVRIGSGVGAYIGRLYAPFSQAEDVKAWAKANEQYVIDVSPDWMVSTAALPNDTDFSSQWGLHNTGQTVQGVTGTAGCDVTANEAWDNTRGDAAVIVAVVDTGINTTHPDLNDNMWVNTGWDTHDNDSVPYIAAYPHGTQVAGVVGAEGNNSQGIAGVAQDVQLMAVKVFGDDGTGTNTDLANGITYVVNQRNSGVNVRVINVSSVTGSNSSLSTAVSNAETAGILIVAAAGNGGADQVGDDNDGSPVYPASYINANVIAVAASTSSDQRSSYSNYGDVSVDLAAPGDNIRVPTSGTGYTYNSGTSFSAPHVAGAAALIASAWPSATTADLRAALLNNVDTVSAWNGYVVTGGRLNAAQALRNVKRLENATENSIVYGGNALHIAYFDETTRALMYVRRNSTGYWSQPVVVEDNANNDTGHNPSIAMDTNGGVGISYYDGYNSDLKYAYSSNGTSWDVQTAQSSSYNGLYSSLVFDGLVPAIAYYRGGTVKELWFIDKSSGSWANPVQVHRIVGGDVGRYPSLAKHPVSGMSWAIAFEDTTNGDLRYAARTTGGVWSNVLADDRMGGAPYTSLVFNGTTASVSYYDAYNGDLRYATRSGGGTWSAQTVASANTVGLYTTLIFNNGLPNILYYNSTGDTLVQASLDGTWSFDVLETDGGRHARGALVPGTSDIAYTWYNTDESDVQFFEP